MASFHPLFGHYLHQYTASIVVDSAFQFPLLPAVVIVGDTHRPYMKTNLFLGGAAASGEVAAADEYIPRSVLVLYVATDEGCYYNNYAGTLVVGS